jgi:hypothetical protein
MAAGRPFRTLDDLERTVRALATEFDADRVFIIGSQAILLGWPDAPTAMRSSPEIDAYPGNAKLWEIEERKTHSGAEASERINGVFGFGSQFHRTHGFYIDGVDENTAKLPTDWQTRALVRSVDVAGKTVLAIAPCPEDLIVSKLARLDPKDKEFIETYHAERPLDAEVIARRLRASRLEPAIVDRAIAYVGALTRKGEGGGGRS